MTLTSQQPAVSWHSLTVGETLSRLDSQPEGLSPEEAERRLAQSGPNRLPSEEATPPWQIASRQVQSPLIYILFIAGALSVLLGDFADAGVIFAVVILDVIVGFFQEYKAERAMRALAQLSAPRARVIRDAVERDLDPANLVPGDIVLLEAGFRVPADLRLIRTIELQTDEALLTGESLPVDKSTGPIVDPAATVADQANIAFMATTITRGRGSGVVIRTGLQTVVGNVASQVRAVGETEAPLRARLKHFTEVIALVVVGITVLVFALGLLRGEPLVTIFRTAVATAVAAVPEGLPVTITVALAVGVWRMAQQHAIVRKLAAVETLGSCSTICSDKTGTLTKNEMTVTRLFASEQTYEVTGVGYAPTGAICQGGQAVGLAADPSLITTLRIGLLCNDSQVFREDDRYRPDGDPTEAALIVAAQKGGLQGEIEREAYPLLDELPFESDRQYMAVLRAHGAERLIFVKGAPERIIEMSDQVERNGSVTSLSRQPALAEFQRLASEGLRVLAMAYRPAPANALEIDHRDVERGLILVGFAGMIDPPRPEAIPAVANCQRAGVRVVMITGDHPVTAQAIAAQIGIVSEPRAPTLDGRELARLSDDELRDHVGRISIYARIMPRQKLWIVEQFMRRGEIIAVTGDGVNDAPALKRADIGVAMGITGTDVAKEAADMILADDNFATIYAALIEGRVVFDNIRKVVAFLIPTGLGLVLSVIGSIILGLPLPYLPAQAIWINLVTNGTQDLAMAFEPAEPNIGNRLPRDPREGVLTNPMLWRTALVGIVLMLGTLGTFIWGLSSELGLDHARTVAMTTMVLFQNVHIFSSRSFTRSAFVTNPFSNPFLFLSVVAALALQALAVYWPPLQGVLRTVPLSYETWLVILPVALTVLLVVEFDKALRRSRSSSASGRVG
ncbi:MAG TPA: HAD-IC family P-type ATPase [Chloroflexota bacterium]|nr:HAD-IC family P-type ATPase [Chloroflexota bacterium]